MKQVKQFIHHSLLSSLCLLAACQAPLAQTQIGGSRPQAAAARAQSAFDHRLDIAPSGAATRVRLLPAGGFSTKLLRRSDIETYRMTISWPGNATGLTVSAPAAADGSLAADLSLDGIPAGNFRAVILEPLDANGDVISDLRAGYVYHHSGSATVQAVLTRQGAILADAIRHFSQSTDPTDQSVFTAWSAAPGQTLTDLQTLIQSVLGQRDALALTSQDLIAAIRTQGDGSLPAANTVTIQTLQQLSFSYEIPSGFYLPEGFSISLDTATSELVEVPAPQQPGVHSLTLPNVYLPATGTRSLDLRIYDSSGDLVQTQAISLDGNGIVAGTPGAANAPLVLDASLQAPLEAAATFYVSPSGNNGNSGASSAQAWQTISYALSQLKTKSLNGDFGTGVPVLIVAAGNYAETDLSIDFPIQLIGAGQGSDSGSNTVISGSGSGRGLMLSGAGNTPTQPIQLANLRVTNFYTGIELAGGSYLNLNQVASSVNSGVGLRVGSAVSITDLNIDNSEFNQNLQGVYFSKESENSSVCENIVFRRSHFDNNSQKGLYFEKLGQALFDRITVANSGTDPAYGFNAGIDINLKGDTAGADPGSSYTDIEIRDSQISGSGVLGTAGNRQFPVAVCIKARDDAASYNGRPANLSDVRIVNTTISGPVNALRFGEPGKNNAGPTGVVISGTSLALEGTDALSRYALLNIGQADLDATDSANRFAGLAANLSNAFAVEKLIYDRIDNSQHGRVATGLPGNTVYLPFQADATHIQPAIDAAQAGDTIVMQAGTYTPAQTLTVQVNKDITLRGEGDGTLFERSVTAAPPTLFNLTGAGATLSDFAIQKLEKTGPDALLTLAANNLTVENMHLSGAYANGDGDVSRAMVGNAGITGFLIQNNQIHNLRQPAYISGASSLSGSILTNRVYGTRGWVIEGAMINFSDNRWRADGQTGTSENFGCDIALLHINNSPVPASYDAFYNVAALEAANSGDLLVAGSGMNTANNFECDQRHKP